MWLHSKTFEVFEDQKKRIAEVRKHDRTEICDVARRTIDNVLGAENSLIRTPLKVELEADRLRLFH